MRLRVLFKYSSALLLVVAIFVSVSTAFAQTTSFTYQGRLTDGGTAANGNYDLQFALWTSLSGGAQVGSTQTLNTVAVSNGVFTVSLDFGAGAFPGASRFLEISARTAGSASFTLLTPRQPITSTPYAVRSLNAASADSVPASGVPPGSGNYIQNNATSTPQTASMNITGSATIGNSVSGTAPIVAKLNVNGGSDAAVFGSSTSFFGVYGQSDSSTGVAGVANNGAGVVGDSSSGIGVAGFSNNSWGVFGQSITGFGVVGRGKIGVLGEGTSFFTGDTTPLPAGVGPGVAIGFDVGGYVFAYDYTFNETRALYLNHQGGPVGIGTTNPVRTLTVAGRARIGSIPQEPSGASVCFNVSGDLLQCGASSLRLKTNVQPFVGGLDIIRRLRPISFDWKDGSGHDIGLGAEEVAQAAPSFTFTDEKGEPTGVKYERLNMLLINAVKEQQAQIKQQERQIKQQQDQLRILKKLVCRLHRRSSVCR
jgi:Chaperone of endosialidase